MNVERGIGEADVLQIRAVESLRRGIISAENLEQFLFNPFGRIFRYPEDQRIFAAFFLEIEPDLVVTHDLKIIPCDVRILNDEPVV